MHTALLIDEILELVLDKCSDWDKQEYQHAVVQFAQTCTAWKDPALDRIWRRLNGTKPLTALLDGVEDGDRLGLVSRFVSVIQVITLLTTRNSYVQRPPYPNIILFILTLPA